MEGLHDHILHDHILHGRSLHNKKSLIRRHSCPLTVSDVEITKLRRGFSRKKGFGFVDKIGSTNQKNLLIEEKEILEHRLNAINHKLSEM